MTTPKTITVESGTNTITITYGGPQGLQGIPGGTLAWHGLYDNGHAYAANDGVISSEGRGCYALQSTTGHAPPSYPTLANAYWSVFAEKGADGTDGTDGDNTADLVDAKGDLLVGSAADDLDRMAVGANGLSLIANSGATLGLSWAELMTDGVYRQALINGSFQVNQKGVAAYTAATVPANSDDTYLHDMWTLLSDGNDIADVSAEATVIPTGGAAAVKFEVETQNKKFGYIQFIENKDAIKYAGKVASLQFKARTTTGKVIRNIRAAVLSWSSTADAVTSDVVSVWGAQGTNPTLAANWTAENTAANLALVADTWTTYKIENISIDTASMANLAVFIWVDDTDCAVDDLLYIADVQLNQGAVCLPYLPRRYEDEVARCSYPISFVPTGAWSTNTTYTGTWQRIGDRAFYQIRVITSGAPTSATLDINLPHTIDTTKLLEAVGQQQVFGYGDILDNGTARYFCVVKYASSTTVRICTCNAAVSNLDDNTPVTQASPMTWAADDICIIKFDVPIVGWGNKARL